MTGSGERADAIPADIARDADWLARLAEYLSREDRFTTDRTLPTGESTVAGLARIARVLAAATRTADDGKNESFHRGERADAIPAEPWLDAFARSLAAQGMGYDIDHPTARASMFATIREAWIAAAPLLPGGGEAEQIVTWLRRGIPGHDTDDAYEMVKIVADAIEAEFVHVVHPDAERAPQPGHPPLCVAPHHPGQLCGGWLEQARGKPIIRTCEVCPRKPDAERAPQTDCEHSWQNVWRCRHCGLVQPPAPARPERDPIPQGRRAPYCPPNGCHCDAVCGWAVIEGHVPASPDPGDLVPHIVEWLHKEGFESAAEHLADLGGPVGAARPEQPSPDSLGGRPPDRESES